eukprot:3597195-Amphidinium_carterae.1
MQALKSSGAAVSTPRVVLGVRMMLTSSATTPNQQPHKRENYLLYSKGTNKIKHWVLQRHSRTGRQKYKCTCHWRIITCLHSWTT